MYDLLDMAVIKFSYPRPLFIELSLINYDLFQVLKAAQGFFFNKLKMATKYR